MLNHLDTILLVDDDFISNLITRRVIESENVADKVVEAKNGLEALVYLKREVESEKKSKIELIFLDINMPMMDGWEFLENFKKEFKNLISKPKIVMLTTSPNVEDKERATRYPEISAYIQKPISGFSLREIFDSLFQPVSN